MLHKLLALHRPLVSRDVNEGHRAATSLELFYDLVIVIAIAIAAAQFHHAVVNNHIVDGVISFLMVFWGIWWTWSGFTFFSAGYDSDDVPYRIAVFVQLIGALILAAGVEPAFEHNDFRLVMTGFIVMRLALVALWLRVYRSDCGDRGMALRSAVGIILCQIGWCILILVLPESMAMGGFVVLALCEHFVPFYAVRKKKSKIHKDHIVERFGLLTIIVLGEALLASVGAIQALVKHYDPQLLNAIIGGLIIIFTVWWLYFEEEEHPVIGKGRREFIWGYGHGIIFAAIAAIGAGLAIVTDVLTDHGKISETIAYASVAIPVAIFLGIFWLIHDYHSMRALKVKMIYPLGAALVLLSVFSGFGLIAIGGILVVMLIARLLWLKPAQ